MGRTHRKLLGVLLLAAGLITILFAAATESPAENADISPAPSASGTVALILYDGPADSGDGLITAREVANLLPHFGFKADIQPIAQYAAGTTEKYPVVFVCGMGNDSQLPKTALEDLSRRSGTVCWICQFIGQLTSMPGMAERLGFVDNGYDDETGYTTVTYRDIDLPKGNQDVNRVKILDPKKVQVLATAGPADDCAPFVLRSGNFWFFAGPVFSFTDNCDQGLIFADLLHDILGVDQPRERRALVRLEDVSAHSDPDDLHRVAKVLIAHKVPFQIELIPVFKDPQSQVEISLSDRPEVVDALHYMVAHGGAVVMHGITHQWHGVSGADYEFWDSLTKKPTPDGSLAALHAKLQRGFEECFRAGLYPVAFETPHYAASFEHYRSLATVFSHCYERRMVCDDIFTSQDFPYETTDIFGQAIVPENLGYVHAEDPDIQPILTAAHGLTVVRDPIASFYFHPFMPAKALDDILTAIQGEGYRFISIKDFAPHAALDDFVVSSTHRKFEVTPRQPFLKTTTMDAQGGTTTQFQAVKVGQPISVDVDPPAGGVVALQSVFRAPRPQPKAGWVGTLTSRLNQAENEFTPPSTVRATHVLIAGDSPSIESALGAYGIPHRRFNPTDPLPDDAVVFVAHKNSLDETTRKRLAFWVGNGGQIVLEAHTSLAERLGFTFDGSQFLAKNLQDLALPDVPINCPKSFAVERFNPPPANVTLIHETSSQEPVAVAVRIGEGKAIYLAAELDPETGLGYTRYPFLILHLQQRFGLKSPVTSDGVEFYFDPGFRDAAPIEQLVASWKIEGVRAIYAGAWHFWPKWNYDYDRLIRLCHEQGIAVYAWLELPSVSPKFWAEHPEWREKTATGRDGEIGWRQFMNLANDDCRAAVMKWADTLLSSHDWDGVNVAELCFDTDDGLNDPATYIPMNDDVRARFQKQAGFDPALLFDEKSPYHWKKNPDALAQWTKYRTGLTRDWLAELLEHVAKHSVDTIVTTLDSISRPRVIEKTGCDSRDVVALMDRYPFTLQVEDPQEMWGDSPNRYLQLGEIYRKLVHDPSRLMFDINVVKDRPAGKAPTALLSGVELALTARGAAIAGNGRIGIYSEATVLEEDRALLPFVMGSRTKATITPGGTTIEATHPVSFLFAPREERRARWNFWSPDLGNQREAVPIVDGQRWAFGTKGRILLGPGKHRITALDSASPNEEPWVKDCTASFTELAAVKKGFELAYSLPRRAWLTTSREPSAVLCDGQPLPRSEIRPQGNDWIVTLPAGSHRAEIEDATTAAVVVREAGKEVSGSIVWLALRGLLFLVSLYVLTRLRRLWLSLHRKPEADNV